MSLWKEHHVRDHLWFDDSHWTWLAGNVGWMEEMGRELSEVVVGFLCCFTPCANDLCTHQLLGCCHEIFSFKKITMSPVMTQPIVGVMLNRCMMVDASRGLSWNKIFRYGSGGVIYLVVYACTNWFEWAVAFGTAESEFT